MKNIFFVQVGFEFDGSVYLPYAAGTIISYCQSDPWIKENYRFSDIIFRREKLNAALEKCSNPYIVAFSCNVWNMEYNKALAKMIKQRYPDCIIVFGGHSVDESAQILADEDYTDILIFGEGERTFRSLLYGLDKEDISDVFNIAYRKNGKIIFGQRNCAESITDYPSPYLEGVFDKIVKENPQVDFLSVLETNRGCPYSCAYCDWCAGKKTRFFPMNKILEEIKWLSKNKISYCFCADSNFGMFERDIEIANALIAAKKATGYPEVFRPCYEKNSDERVFSICSALNSVGMDKGATMAYQTLSPKALENIGRKNLTLDHFSSLVKRYNQAGIPTYSELILGLPGETKESFCKGICELFENGQHNSVSVYHCEVLPNSDLAKPEYMEKHKIEVIKVAFNHIHSAPKKDEEVKEYSYLVRSTATLNREDWVYANLFSVCVQCFHSLGLLRFFALFLHQEKKISYYNFYTNLLRFIMSSNGNLNNLWVTFKNKYETSLEGDWNYVNPAFGNVTWFFEEGAFLEIVNSYDEYFSELIPFLTRYSVKDDVFEQLLSYQKTMLRKPFEEKICTEYDYDFHNYFKSIIAGRPAVLNEKKTVIDITPNICYGSFSEYAKETVWFGRRRGATIYYNKEIVLTHKFKDSLL